MVILDAVTPLARTDTLPSNMSNAELLLVLDNDYPNLQGPLRMVVDRFRAELHAQMDELPKEVQCPACGTQLRLTWGIVP